jgi:hypothetical protein
LVSVIVVYALPVLRINASDGMNRARCGFFGVDSEPW